MATRLRQLTDSDRKVTLILSAETDVKLSVLAACRGVNRSVLAEELLAEALKEVEVSVPSSSNDFEAGVVGEEVVF